MQMNPVSSSMIQEIGYDPETKTLRVRFKRKNILWQYEDVPSTVYDQLTTSDSIGKCFHADIRNIYSARRLYETE